MFKRKKNVTRHAARHWRPATRSGLRRGERGTGNPRPSGRGWRCRTARTHVHLAERLRSDSTAVLPRRGGPNLPGLDVLQGQQVILNQETWQFGCATAHKIEQEDVMTAVARCFMTPLTLPATKGVHRSQHRSPPRQHNPSRTSSTGSWRMKPPFKLIPHTTTQCGRYVNQMGIGE